MKKTRTQASMMMMMMIMQHHLKTIEAQRMRNRPQSPCVNFRALYIANNRFLIDMAGLKKSSAGNEAALSTMLLKRVTTKEEHVKMTMTMTMMRTMTMTMTRMSGDLAESDPVTSLSSMTT